MSIHSKSSPLPPHVPQQQQVYTHADHTQGVAMQPPSRSLPLPPRTVNLLPTGGYSVGSVAPLNHAMNSYRVTPSPLINGGYHGNPAYINQAGPAPQYSVQMSMMGTQPSPMQAPPTHGNMMYAPPTGHHGYMNTGVPKQTLNAPYMRR